MNFLIMFFSKSMQNDESVFFIFLFKKCIWKENMPRYELKVSLAD